MLQASKNSANQNTKAPIMEHGIIASFYDRYGREVCLRIPSPYQEIGPYNDDIDVFECQLVQADEVRLVLHKGEAVIFAERLIRNTSETDYIAAYTYQNFKEAGGKVYLGDFAIEENAKDIPFKELLDHPLKQSIKLFTHCGYLVTNDE